MAIGYPTSLDSLQRKANKAGVTVVADNTIIYATGSAVSGDYNDLEAAIEQLEIKAGVTNSAVTTSLDFRTQETTISYNVKLHGALGNGTQHLDAAMSSVTNTTTLTSASGSFTSSDVGKFIQVNGAGASGAALITTISSVTNATTAVLGSACLTTVSGATYTYGTDDTAAFTGTATAATNAGNGLIKIPAGMYIVGSTITEYANVYWEGAGVNATILFLKGNANCNVFQTKDFATLTQTSPGGYSGPGSFGFRGLAIDGNKIGNTSGGILTIRVTNGGTGYTSAPTIGFTGGGGSGASATATVSGGAVTLITVNAAGSGFTSIPTVTFTGGGGSNAAAVATLTGCGFAFYGQAYYLRDIVIRNCFSDGIYTEWASTSSSSATDQMEGHWQAVKVHDCNMHGIDYSGPHDTLMTDVVSYNNAATNSGYQLYIHSSGIAQIAQFHGYEPANANTPAIFCDTSQVSFVDCVAEGNPVGPQVIINQNTCRWISGSVFSATTSVPPLTANCTGIQIGTASNGAGFCRVEGVFGSDLPGGLIDFSFSTGSNVCKGSIYIPEADPPLAAQPAGYKGTWNINDEVEILVTGITPAQNATQNPIIHHAPWIRAFAPYWSQQTITANGQTINWQNSNGAFELARPTNAGSFTGMILQPGVVDGQMIRVVNEGTGSLQFAASGTSHVAGGTGCTINAGFMKIFSYDLTAGLWYSD